MRMSPEWLLSHKLRECSGHTVTSTTLLSFFRKETR